MTVPTRQFQTPPNRRVSVVEKSRSPRADFWCGLLFAPRRQTVCVLLLFNKRLAASSDQLIALIMAEAIDEGGNGGEPPHRHESSKSDKLMCVAALFNAFIMIVVSEIGQYTAASGLAAACDMTRGQID